MPGEREKLAKAKAKARVAPLRASPQAPKEVLTIQRKAMQKIPEPPKGKLTRQGLEQRLRALPGEREKLEKVKKGFKPSASVIGEKGFSLSWLNP